MVRHRHFRPLNNLRCASTARVLNLLSVAETHGQTDEYKEKPFFRAPQLNTAILLKHRLRRDDTFLFDSGRTTALKVILPFAGDDLRLGGRSFFFKQRGYMDCLTEIVKGSDSDIDRDVRALQLLDELPSLDPFLLKEIYSSNRLIVADCYFQISEPDRRKMQDFVSENIRGLIMKAIGDGTDISSINLEKIANALLAAEDDAKLEPLRLTLKLEAEEFRQGMFSWRGMLYYKWCSKDMWPEIGQVFQGIRNLQIVGGCTRSERELIESCQRSLATNVKKAQIEVIQTLTAYDTAYNELVSNGQPAKFKAFLLSAPKMFRELGERFGSLNHIASFWNYRFPRGGVIRSDIEEAIMIFTDFESCFGESSAAMRVTY